MASKETTDNNTEVEVVILRPPPYLGHRAPDDLPDDWASRATFGDDPRPLPK